MIEFMINHGGPHATTELQEDFEMADADPKPETEVQTTEQGYIEMELLQVWQTIPTYILHPSDVETYECWKCECVWVKQ